MPRLISIIIPCCNEEEALEHFPARLFPLLDSLTVPGEQRIELILVDDGSRDRTLMMLRKFERESHVFQVVLGQHSDQRGLGAALVTGQKLASGEVIMTLDSDGTYPFEIVRQLIAAIDEGADIATVSPDHPSGSVDGVSAIRLIFSRGASTLYRILVDPSIHTYTALVRSYRAPVLAAAIADDAGFLNVAKTLVEARRRGARIVEIPATLAQRNVGQSKARILRITRAHLSYMRQLVLLRLTGRFWLAEARPDRLETVSHG